MLLPIVGGVAFASLKKGTDGAPPTPRDPPDMPVRPCFGLGCRFGFELADREGLPTHLQSRTALPVHTAHTPPRTWPRTRPRTLRTPPRTPPRALPRTPPRTPPRTLRTPPHTPPRALPGAYALKFDETALIFGMIGNIFAAFKGSENKKLMDVKGLKDRMGGVANQFALTEARAALRPPPTRRQRHRLLARSVAASPLPHPSTPSAPSCTQPPPPFPSLQVLAFLISVPVMFMVEGAQWPKFVELVKTDRNLQAPTTPRPTAPRTPYFPATPRTAPPPPTPRSTRCRRSRASLGHLAPRPSHPLPRPSHPPRAPLTSPPAPPRSAWRCRA